MFRCLLNRKNEVIDIKELEKINIPVETLHKLADYYNTSIDYLLYRTDERKPYSKSIVK